MQLVKDERLVKEEVLLLQDRGKQRSIALKGGYMRQNGRAGEVQLLQCSMYRLYGAVQFGLSDVIHQCCGVDFPQ